MHATLLSFEDCNAGYRAAAPPCPGPPNCEVVRAIEAFRLRREREGAEDVRARGIAEPRTERGVIVETDDPVGDLRRFLGRHEYARLEVPELLRDPADGGRPPYEIYLRALESGRFVDVAVTGSLRVLERV